MGGYRLQQLRGYSFDEIKTLFETTMRRVNTFVPIETKVRRGVLELVADSLQTAVRETGGTKRTAKEELSHQSFKKQKLDDLSQEELQQLMINVPKEGMNIEALQTKYPIIDWEIIYDLLVIDAVKNSSQLVLLTMLCSLGIDAANDLHLHDHGYVLSAAIGRGLIRFYGLLRGFSAINGKCNIGAGCGT
nr:hypothetical protein [Tanacetum cinerariifolium]